MKRYRVNQTTIPTELDMYIMIAVRKSIPMVRVFEKIKRRIRNPQIGQNAFYSLSKHLHHKVRRLLRISVEKRVQFTLKHQTCPLTKTFVNLLLCVIIVC